MKHDKHKFFEVFCRQTTAFIRCLESLPYRYIRFDDSFSRIEVNMIRSCRVFAGKSKFGSPIAIDTSGKILQSYG